jgi:hypothetical protein
MKNYKKGACPHFIEIMKKKEKKWLPLALRKP